MNSYLFFNCYRWNIKYNLTCWVVSGGYWSFSLLDLKQTSHLQLCFYCSLIYETPWTHRLLTYSSPWQRHPVQPPSYRSCDWLRVTQYWWAHSIGLLGCLLQDNKACPLQHTLYLCIFYPTYTLQVCSATGSVKCSVGCLDIWTLYVIVCISQQLTLRLQNKFPSGQ